MYTFDRIDAKKLEDNPPYSNECWEDQIYNRVKKNLKSYLCRRQKRMCIYCKTELEVACDAEHIEHIIHKEFKPIWMFEPINLGISCSQCNTSKGVKHALRLFARNAVVVPQGSAFYRIVHPYFDIYDKHIGIENDLFIKAKDNDKGKTTIDICKLWRPLYADRRARAISISQSDRHTIALARSQRTDISQDEIDAFLEYVDELADMI